MGTSLSRGRVTTLPAGPRGGGGHLIFSSDLAARTHLTTMMAGRPLPPGAPQTPGLSQPPRRRYFPDDPALAPDGGGGPPAGAAAGADYAANPLLPVVRGPVPARGGATWSRHNGDSAPQSAVSPGAPRPSPTPPRTLPPEEGRAATEGMGLGERGRSEHLVLRPPHGEVRARGHCKARGGQGRFATFTPGLFLAKLEPVATHRHRGNAPGGRPGVGSHKWIPPAPARQPRADCAYPTHRTPARRGPTPTPASHRLWAEPLLEGLRPPCDTGQAVF
ncbi:hypothetical protein FQA47_023900, partial [Oryzias melastigma]